MELEFKGLAPEMGLFGLHARFFKFDVVCSTNDCRPPKITTETPETTSEMTESTTEIPETTSEMTESTTTAGGDAMIMIGSRMLTYFLTILVIMSLNSEI